MMISRTSTSTKDVADARPPAVAAVVVRRRGPGRRRGPRRGRGVGAKCYSVTDGASVACKFFYAALRSRACARRALARIVAERAQASTEEGCPGDLASKEADK